MLWVSPLRALLPITPATLPCAQKQFDRVGCLYRMRYGSYSKDVVWIVPGGLLGLIFAGYVLLASQKRYPH